MLIYNNTVDFDYQDKGHRYTVKKKVGEAWTIPEPVVGTTTVTGIIHKPALMLWPMNEALKYIRTRWVELDLDELAHVLPAGYEGHTPYAIREDVLVQAAQAHKKKSQYGKDAGKVGHGMVEALLKGEAPEKPSDDLLEAGMSIKTAFERYQEDFAPEMLHCEIPAYSLTHNFAGTVDDVSMIDGRVTVTDYKTTNPSYYNPDGIYAENFAQLGAYAILVEEMLELEVEEAQIVNLPKDGSDYKIKSLSDMGLTITDAKLYFLHALGLYNIHGLIGGRLK